MHRIILVDDEPWVLVGLERLINWNDLGFEIAASCESSRAAWECILKDPPSAVIADIRMPGLSGLELLKRVREAELPTEVVLISAFADFSYAQEALRNGAFEYLLKPVRQEQLTACMVKLHERLTQTQSTRKREETAQTQEILLISRTVEEAFSRLTGSAPAAGEWEAAVVTSAAFPGETSGALPGTRESLRVPLSGEFSLILCVPEDDGTALYEAMLRSGGTENTDESFGMCAEKRGKASPEKMIWHARMARISAKFIGKKGLKCSTDTKGYAEEKAFFTALDYQQGTLLERHMKQLRQSVLDGTLMLDRLTPLLWRMDRRLQQTQGKPSLFHVPLNRYTDLVQNDPDCNALFDRLEAAILFSPESAAMKAVMEEINCHYMHARTLVDLAGEFGVSQAGLSQMIRKQTGKTYSELIQERRLEKACELLTYSDETVAAIAEMTGYSDPFYFSKQFKRAFGMSPNAYRKKKCD